MSSISVYHYDSALRYLSDAFEAQKALNPKFSLRAFCKACGFGAHTLLVMILKKRRKLNLRHIGPLASGLGLTSLEAAYLQTLIQLEQARSEEERNLYRLWLNDLNPRRNLRSLDEERYQSIADWIHMAVLALARVSSTPVSAEEISKLTGNKVSPTDVARAIERLSTLGLLRMDSGGWSPSDDGVHTPDDIANRAAREYHRQVSSLAAQAIEEQDPLVREFQGFALPVSSEKLPLAKQLIRKFRASFSALVEGEAPDSVYQCNLQFFRLLENPSPATRSAVTKENSQADAETANPGLIALSHSLQEKPRETII